MKNVDYCPFLSFHTFQVANLTLPTFSNILIICIQKYISCCYFQEEKQDWVKWTRIKRGNVLFHVVCPPSTFYRKYSQYENSLSMPLRTISTKHAIFTCPSNKARLNTFLASLCAYPHHLSTSTPLLFPHLYLFCYCLLCINSKNLRSTDKSVSILFKIHIFCWHCVFRKALPTSHIVLW